MFNKSLTIVLPVYNAESRLRKNVRELLELASDLTARFGVLIIDDGSTDSTYEVAEELASYFPQVKIRRHRQCLGLGASLEYVQRRVRSDAVIVHDGVTPINSLQVRTLWRQWLEDSKSCDGGATKSATTPHDALDVASLQSIHGSLERVHRQMIGFQLMNVSPSSTTSKAEATPATEPARRNTCHTHKPAGVGRIPSLPRPKFLSALADFALGE